MAFFKSYQDKVVIDKKLNINLIIFKEEIHLNLSQLDLVNIVISLPIAIVYGLTRYWLLNNFYGIIFSVIGIQTLNLPNFQIAFILLWGLFFYDIFWVYGTDVMVTVAKSVDAPIKLLFPVDLLADPPVLSMLGLGDIVIPGIFVALCLRYDINRQLA